MKAVVLNEAGQLQLADVAAPVPRQGELLIRIIAAGFNPIDYQMRENEMERKLLHSPILGREFSGIVVETGEGVEAYKQGDAVFGASGSMGSNGTYAEYIAVPEAIVMHKPAGITFTEAAAISSAGLTALQCFNRMKLAEEDTVFITGGAGGVGTMLIKILLAHRFYNFIATAGNDDSILALQQAGVKDHQIINYQTDEVETTALVKNGHKKFDVAADLVGGRIAENAARLLKVNGTYLDVTALLTANARETLFDIGATILNISNYAYAADKNYGYYKTGLAEIARLLNQGSITPPPVEVLGLLNVDTVEKAHDILRRNKTRGKKLVMQIQPGS